LKACSEMDFQFFTIDGVRIRVGVTHRNPAGTPLLLFNGIGGSMELLQPIIEALENTRVITYDVPGAGESQPPPFPWRPRHHAKLAAALLDRLSVDQINVLGISWGGVLAQQFARQYPERTEHLILAATSPGQLMVPARPGVLLRMSNPLRYFSAEYMRAIAPTIYGGTLRTNKLKVKEHASKMKPPSVKGYYYQMLSLVGWSSLPWLHQLKLPTLVMAGGDDPIIPLINARILVRGIPNSRLQIVDCGHLFLLTRAKRLARDIERFFGTSH
jgi:poly(3-hydroxyalkanoate) depolymerase